jgi:hypothetical protein
MDLISGVNGTLLSMDKLPTNINGTSITFSTADIPSRLQANDYMCFAEQTCIPPFPAEVMTYLVYCTSMQILDAQGDFEALQALQAKAARAEKAILTLLQPRTTGESRKLRGSGLLRRNRGSTLRNWR